MHVDAGTLYVVSTPIGNLGDITYRGVAVLQQVALVACEDTRRARVLLEHYHIQKPVTSYFEHNKISKARMLVGKLRQGLDIALVSDAGTPGISDPGYRIIQEALSNECAVVAIPGASAGIAALSVSGLPTDKFAFEGFLPPKIQARRNRIKQLQAEKRTVIVYESPHRILATLIDIQAIIGDIHMVCAREITKLFEEIRREPVSLLIAHFQAKRPKGEFVLLFNVCQTRRQKQ
jgi:16S rRNA (cytidine1402-2'-O)-methyltransferase